MSTAMVPQLTTHVATGGYLFNTIDGKTVYLHVAAAERALGKPLPHGAEVHHVNGNPADNQNKNLVICVDHEYHSLLHRRQMALEITGNPNLRMCKICQIFDNPARMKPHGKQFYHIKCKAFESRKQRARAKQNRG